MFDPTKPVQTRDGRKARILCADAKYRSGETITAHLLNDDGTVHVTYGYFSDGRFNKGEDDDLDLVNVNVLEKRKATLHLHYNARNGTVLGSPFKRDSSMWRYLEDIEVEYEVPADA